jgi:hypothetical protein
MTSWPCNGVLCTDGTGVKVDRRGDMKKLAAEKALLRLINKPMRFWWNSVSAYVVTLLLLAPSRPRAEGRRGLIFQSKPK